MTTRHPSSHKNSPTSSDLEMSDQEAKQNRPLRERLAKDKFSIALLLFLYILQGLPIGLAGSVPIILQMKKIGYRQQALFSLVTWPFTIKLLWAPLVDSVYSRSFGRRKSWLVPSQYMIGLTMIFLSYLIKGLLGDETTAPSVVSLTVVFFFLHFLTATQDIAVDGWALTMLSKENVGYASTCNTVGQTAGFFLSYTLFLALQSTEFCNSYIRWEPQSTGLVELPSFMYVIGIIFMIVTTFIWWFKQEKREEYSEEKTPISNGYWQLLGVLKLPNVQMYALAILTSKIAFAAADSVTGLKLIEAGLPSERIALMAVPLVPVQIVLPWIISRFTTGPRPLDVFMKAYLPRVLMGVAFAAIVWWTPRVNNDGSFPVYYYIIVIGVFLVQQVFAYSMFVSGMAFHAKISDPAIGGTYMTLLNTIMNMAGTWVGTLALWLTDNVSVKDCEGVSDDSLDCDTMHELQACEAAGGHCVTYVDGYYVEMVLCVTVGVIWVWWQRKRIGQLQDLREDQWRART
ncbi:acetyl-coenzyme A transporter 1-like [Halichondria panicea]|uniref:acetyl-coenzyme A transporter 1-like n=1 Tax=Halichondria panicea TaxID=6063 RepID=UPI00312BAA35